MSSPRLRRLMADFELIKDEFTGSPHVQVQPVQGNPPERYLVTYRVRGLRWDAARNCPVELGLHKAEIYLGADYPREKPKCLMHTEIFHPNFGSYICIGDHWAAGETLADVIVQIGDLIQYREYNVKSPLNAVAAQWTMQNERLLPLGNIELRQAEPDIELSLGAGEAPRPMAPALADDEVEITLGS
jgi:ubiquitin-protein ligase